MPTRRTTGLFLFTLLVAAFLTVASPADAAWYYAHGQSGHVERDDRVTNYPFYFGWGLDITQSPGLSNWVHFSVPSLGGGTKGVRFLRLKFRTGSVDAWVSDVHVYDGNIRFQTIPDLTYSGFQDVLLDLGQVWRINRALGVSIKINAGVESMSHNFKFYAVGANFVTAP